MTAQHHDFSPSASARWLACAGSVSACRDLPDTRSEAAREGSAAHLVFEQCLLRGAFAADYLGKSVTLQDGSTWTVDGEMVEAVQSAVDVARAYRGFQLTEQRVSLDPWIPGGHGRADLIVIDDGVATVLDFKYGRGVRVYARDNSQPKLYALGTWHDLGHLYEIDAFRLVILQPRLDHVDEWIVPVRDLLDWAESVVRPAVAAALQPDPPFAPSEAACRWCRAAPRCRALAEHSLAAARTAFVDPSPALTNAEIGDILGRLPVVEAWIARVREAAFGELTAGREVPGWKLVEGRSVRAWRDPEEAAARLLAAGASEAQVFERKLISPTQAEKTFGRSHGAMECVVKPAGKPTMASTDDKRPAIRLAAADVFAPETL